MCVLTVLGATPSVSAILTDSASVAWSAPNNGGSAITGYDVQVATDSGFTANVVQVLGATTSPRTLSPLLPGTGYFARVRANNAVGAGAWSPAASFTTLSGLKVKVDGAWLTTRVWVKIDGSWRLAKVWKRVDGAWLT